MIYFVQHCSKLDDFWGTEIKARLHVMHELAKGNNWNILVLFEELRCFSGFFLEVNNYKIRRNNVNNSEIVTIK